MERNVTPFVINSLRVITFVFRINKGYFLVLYPSLPPYSFHFPSFNSALYLGYLLELHPFFCPRWREEKRKESRTDKQKSTKLRFVFPQVSSSSFPPSPLRFNRVYEIKMMSRRHFPPPFSFPVISLLLSSATIEMMLHTRITKNRERRRITKNANN